MTDLRDALRLFEHFASEATALPKVLHLEVLSHGYAAAARGWRLLVEGEGDEEEILIALATATIQLQGNLKRPVGARKKQPDEPDQIVLDRYFNRDPLTLPLRHFVEIAFDEGVLDRKVKVDVHVNRIQRYLDR